MHTRTITIAILAVGLLWAAPAEAAKKNRGKGEKRVAARVLARFDADSSGTIDSMESKRLRMVFETLKKLDTDNNGELSDSEIAAPKIEKDGKKGKKKQGKGKNRRNKDKAE